MTGYQSIRDQYFLIRSVPETSHIPKPPTTTLSPSVFTRYFGEEKFTLLKLHGSMEQSERVPVYNKFNGCSAGILFTTDVAARGLDLPVIKI